MVLATVNDAEVPFVARMRTTAYDWVGRTDAVKEQDLVDILKASGFNGKVLGYDATNSSLLIESTGVLKAAVATSLSVNIKCVPISGHEDVCPPSIAVSVPESASGAPATSAEAIRAPMAARGGGDGVFYKLDLPAKRH